MHASSTSCCSPSHISAASPQLPTSDFFLLLESEMARNTAAFKQEVDRIAGGDFRLGREDPVRRQLEESNQSLRKQLADVHEELVQAGADRDSAVARAKEQLEELEIEKDRLHQLVQRLSDENRDLSKKVRDLATERREQDTKQRLEDKYRRALVYIDALQSKLSSSPTPPRRARPQYR